MKGSITLLLMVVFTPVLYAQPGWTGLHQNVSVSATVFYPPLAMRYGAHYNFLCRYKWTLQGGGQDSEGMFSGRFTDVYPYRDLGITVGVLHSVRTNSIAAWEIELKQSSMVWKQYRIYYRNIPKAILASLGTSVGYGQAIDGAKTRWCYAVLNINLSRRSNYRREFPKGRFRLTVFLRGNLFLQQQAPDYISEFAAGVRVDFMIKSWRLH